MSRIRLLPEHVANQIAAGEVVERPASVVKELIENALDAQASRITVDIQAGGRSLVRITDDGLGMSRDDALLCLERHATSKIQRAEDLFAISTMGFRGEALPSIASVSRMTLTTRERDGGAEGTQVIINGGKILEVKAAGAPPGTSVEIRNLFFNLPARRKFLRSEETEYAHIHHYVTLAALAFPEVAFTLTKDNRTVWQLASAKTGNTPAARLAALRERLRAVLGGELRLLPVDRAIELSDGEDPAGEAEALSELHERPANAAASSGSPASTLRVWGFIGAPGVARSTREDQHLFVNRRPVENRGLNHALLEGYHTVLMKGRYPVCCLFVELDPSLVDVNIHPSKREVKFHQERTVRHFVANAVRQALLDFHAVPAAAGTPARFVSAPVTPSLPTGATSAPLPQPVEAYRTKTVTPSSHQQLPLAAPDAPPLVTTAQPLFSPAPHRPVGPPSPPVMSPESSRASSSAMTSTAAAGPRPMGEPLPLLNVPLRLVGVVGELYVVLESDRGLVLLDQHAAHERILFEQMLTRLESGTVPSQRLLLPETVELSIRDALFLRENLETLNRLGVGLGEFGERTFLLDAVPPLVKPGDSRRFVLELIDGLKEAGQEVNSQRLGEHTIAKTVCRHAVKAHDPLGGPELENLVNDLRRCAMPYTCPHGRPTMIEMNFRELEKKFGRLM
jgi:DNA mismatch repair protein MutL